MSDTKKEILLVIFFVTLVFLVVFVGGSAAKRLGAESPIQTFYSPPGTGFVHRKDVVVENQDIMRFGVDSYSTGGVNEPNMLTSPSSKLNATYPSAHRPNMQLNATAYSNSYAKPLASTAMQSQYSEDPATKQTLKAYGRYADAYALPKPNNLSASMQDPSQPSTFINNAPMVLPMKQRNQGVDRIRGDTDVKPIIKGWFDSSKYWSTDLERGGQGIIFGDNKLGCGCADVKPPLSGSGLRAESDIMKQYSGKL